MEQKKSKKGLIIGLIAGIVTVAVTVTTVVALMLRPKTEDKLSSLSPDKAVTEAFKNLSTSDSFSLEIPSELFSSPVKSTLSFTIKSLDIEDIPADMLSNMGISVNMSTDPEALASAGVISITKGNSSIIDLNVAYKDNNYIISAPQLFDGAYSININDIATKYPGSGLEAMLSALGVDGEEFFSQIAAVTTSQSTDENVSQTVQEILDKAAPIEEALTAFFEDAVEIVLQNEDVFKEVLSAKVLNENVKLECGNCTEYEVTIDTEKLANAIIDVALKILDTDSYSKLADTCEDILGSDATEALNGLKSEMSSSKDEFINEMKDEIGSSVSFNVFIRSDVTLAKVVFNISDKESATIEFKGKKNIFEKYEIICVDDNTVFTFEKDGSKYTFISEEDGSEEVKLVFDIKLESDKSKMAFSINEFSIAIGGSDLISFSANASAEAISADEIVIPTEYTDILSLDITELSSLLNTIQQNALPVLASLGVTGM